MKHPTFASIDFETADREADSACSVGIVRVENGKIAQRFHCLIRPPRPNFLFTYIHGITWGQVCLEPSFREQWPRMQAAIGEARFLAAHNASFDRKVMSACCSAAGITPPEHPYECTVRLARKTWSIYPTQLPMVCAQLSIPLKHHEALSDAEACARIVLAGLQAGWKPDLPS
ncbi:MAG: 3'-5' exonuclease [Elusimicrobiota bacterium]|jgi:DNA polymerase-3 subunit epsilon